MSEYTRFGIGGPADLLIDVSSESTFIDTLRELRESGRPFMVIGKGTNLIVSDGGFRGVILRFTGSSVTRQGTCVTAEAGAELQHLVDFTISQGLRGLETMTGIPGWAGAAVYGNAGAYGHSINERIESVRFFDAEQIRTFSNAECRFDYRESIFKDHKEWIILSANLALDPADPAELKKIADDILAVRNAKYPPTMKCAGSIFKNLLWNDLPAGVRARIPDKVVRDGKVPSAWFLEQVGAKGIRRGDIQVATYHANLIYNDGQGTASDLCAVIDDLKARVQERYQFPLEEEVQYVGFSDR